MARALVLGATGHIGAHIVRALLGEGHTVRAAYRRERYLSVLEGLDVERVRVDTDTPATVREAARGCEWVFYAAGYYPPVVAGLGRHVPRAVASARGVLAALREAGPSRVVFTSSAAVIRRVPGRAATEADLESWPPEGRRNAYARAKIAMDQEAVRAAAAGLPVVFTHPSVCLGEYDAHPFSGLLILAYAKYRAPWYPDRRLNLVYTGDVGVGHVRAAARGAPGSRYLLTGETWHLRDLARLIAETAGTPAAGWRLPFSLGPDQLLDGGKARRELGLPQTPIREAVRRAVAWFRANGYC